MGLRRNIRLALEPPFTRLGLAVLARRLPRRAILALARFMGCAGYWCSALQPPPRAGQPGPGVRRHPDRGRKAAHPAAASLRNFALTTLDLFWFTRRPEERMARWFEATPALQAAMARHVPRVGVTGHFGNWELMGRYFGAARRAGDERGDAAEESRWWTACCSRRGR